MNILLYYIKKTDATEARLTEIHQIIRKIAGGKAVYIPLKYRDKFKHEHLLQTIASETCVDYYDLCDFFIGTIIFFNKRRRYDYIEIQHDYYEFCLNTCKKYNISFEVLTNTLKKCRLMQV